MPTCCDGFGIGAAGGGFIADRKTKVYSFPISIIDLSTYVDQTAILHVPFEGEFKLPEQNVSRFEETTEAMGPYLAGVTDLHVDGDLLELVVGIEKSAVAVAFDLASFNPAPATHER